VATTEDQYQSLIQLAQKDDGIIGLILAGGRGKGIYTPSSDYDVYVITKDEQIVEIKSKLARFKSKELDLVIMSERELMLFGIWGSDTEWHRYNFAHAQAVIDKNKRIALWLNEQESIPNSAIEEAIKQSLDGYLNFTHHSLKNLCDGKAIAVGPRINVVHPQLPGQIFGGIPMAQRVGHFLDQDEVRLSRLEAGGRTIVRPDGSSTGDTMRHGRPDEPDVPPAM